jgi:heptosyltransferase-2
MKIGLWQTAFLGDAVLTLPLLQRLRQARPDAEIHYFVRGGLEAMFSATKAADAVRGYAKRGAGKPLVSAARLGRRLAREDFDLWVSAHRSLRSAVVSRLAAAPFRVGYDSPWFNRIAYTDVVDRRFHELEEIERLMELARPLGLDPAPPWPQLDLPPAAQDAAERLLAGFSRGPLLGVHPGSIWPTKRWPAQYFGRVMAMAAEWGAAPVLFAGPGEEATAARALEASDLERGCVLDLSGRLDLPTLAACLDRVSAYLTNDSGPMHLAWVQGTPVAAVFGPTVRELGFFPRGERSVVLEEDLDCRPCGLHGPKQCPLGHHDCMRRIAPERVWEAVRGLLEADAC